MVKLGRLCFDAGLTTKQAEVVILAFAEGMSHKEMAEHLDIEIVSVRERMKAALKKLRVYCEDNEIAASDLRMYGMEV